MRKHFMETLMQHAREDSRIWLLCGDLGYSVLEPFEAEFPDRFINVGVAEQNMASVAAGLALTGRVVVTYSIGNFGTLRCFEQIRNDVCYHDANVKIVSVGGGLVYGGHGYTHHAIEDLAVMRSLPGMRVIAPADPAEAEAATRWMLASPHPCYLRLEKAGEPALHASLPSWGEGRILPMLQGRDMLILATGSIVGVAQELSRELVKEGVQAGVASCPFIKPFDTEFVQQQAAQLPLIVTLEEHSVIGGLADCVAKSLAAMPGHRARHAAFGVQEGVLKGISGDHAQLRERAGISTAALLPALRALLKVA